MKIGDPKHFRWLEGIVAAVFILNVMDGVLTIVWYMTGRAEEANPLMAGAIGLHPVVFILLKIALVALGSVLLWRYRHRAMAVVGIFIAFIAYYWVLIYHLSAMNVGILFEWLN